MEKWKAMELMFGQMGRFIEVNGRITKCMVKASSIGQMAHISKELTRMMKEPVKES
jgi:hypothetical protein